MYCPVEPLTTVLLTWNGPRTWWHAAAGCFRVPVCGLALAGVRPGPAAPAWGAARKVPRPAAEAAARPAPTAADRIMMSRRISRGRLRRPVASAGDSLII